MIEQLVDLLTPEAKSVVIKMEPDPTQQLARDIFTGQLSSEEIYRRFEELPKLDVRKVARLR